jgi:hypothetical protein
LRRRALGFLESPTASLSIRDKSTKPMKNIDQLNIRIRGKAYLGRKLRLGEHVKLVIEGDVVREETEDNQDGSVNICYIIHPMRVEDVNPPPPPALEPAPQTEDFSDMDEFLAGQERIDAKDVPF